MIMICLLGSQRHHYDAFDSCYGNDDYDAFDAGCVMIIIRLMVAMVMNMIRLTRAIVMIMMRLMLAMVMIMIRLTFAAGRNGDKCYILRILVLERDIIKKMLRFSLGFIQIPLFIKTLHFIINY